MIYHAPRSLRLKVSRWTNTMNPEFEDTLFQPGVSANSMMAQHNFQEPPEWLIAGATDQRVPGGLWIMARRWGKPVVATLPARAHVPLPVVCSWPALIERGGAESRTRRVVLQ